MLGRLWGAGKRDGTGGDRRRDLRRASVFQVAKLTTARAEELCVVRDVSAGGIKAEVYCPVAIGERITITLRTEHAVTGRVAWIDGPVIGITFDAETPMLAMLAHCSFDERVGSIRPVRLTTRMAGRLRVGRDILDVDVRDISQAGMKVAVAHPLAADAACEIVLAGLGDRAGTIRWVRDDHAGIMLTEAIGYAEFSAWRRSHGGPMASQPLTA